MVSHHDLPVSVDGRSVSFLIDETLFPLDVVYGTAYLFVDRCYVFFSRSESNQIEAQLTAKEEASVDELEALSGEFANELLNQSLRFRVSQSTAKIREYYMARAFLSHPAQSSIDALLAELDAEEMAEDDLEISVPWEEQGG